MQRVRDAARKHAMCWAELIPDRITVNVAAEAAEEAAYREMAAAKHALRDHICTTYGISACELSSLSAL